MSTRRTSNRFVESTPGCDRLHPGAAKQMIAQGSGGKIINPLDREPAGVLDFRPLLRREIRHTRHHPGDRPRPDEHGITVNAFAPASSTRQCGSASTRTSARSTLSRQKRPEREFATGTLMGRPAHLRSWRVPGLPPSPSPIHDGADVHGGRRAGPCLKHCAAARGSGPLTHKRRDHEAL